MVSQMSCGFSTKNQCWQTCIFVIHVIFVWSQWSPCPTAENGPTTKLRTDYEGKRAGRYSRGGKKIMRKARGEGPPSGRGKDGEKTTAGKHGIPGLDREPGVARSLLSSKYIKNSVSVLHVAGWQMRTTFSCTHYAINSSERSLPGYNGFNLPHSHLKISPSYEMSVFSLAVSGESWFFFSPKELTLSKAIIKEKIKYSETRRFLN